jgi:endonuclease YncB( thermonuclease family)
MWRVALVCLLAAGCRPTDLVADGGADAAVAPDLAGQSQCPPPPMLGLTDVPAGYLPAQKVTLRYGIDGDTAHFAFATGEFTVRFLYLNTEESYGDMTTAFGVASGETVKGWLAAAQEIHIAQREHRTLAGQPALDPYNRRLGLVFLDGELLETRIVREGLSAYYTEYGCAPGTFHQALLYAEAEAYAAQRGIWTPGHPTDYRMVLANWIDQPPCRPNPYRAPYCR